VCLLLKRIFNARRRIVLVEDFRNLAFGHLAPVVDSINTPANNAVS
jgi:hypothetical protein